MRYSESSTKSSLFTMSHRVRVKRFPLGPGGKRGWSEVLEGMRLGTVGQRVLPSHWGCRKSSSHLHCPLVEKSECR